MKGFGLFAVLLVSALISLWMGIRARIRVRKLMKEPIVEAAACGIDRSEVRRFFAETQVFRAAVEDRVENPDGPKLLVEDHAHAAHRVSDFNRTVRDWERLYEDGLDDEDRHALGERDITTARIEAMKPLATAENPANLRRLLIELRAIEMRMSEPPRTAAYR